MKKFNRELLVLFRTKSNSNLVERQVESLHELLYHVEKVENIAIAHEVVHVKSRKIIKRPRQVLGILNAPKLKPFVFLNNLN
ncbi:MAG: hypothetical protein M9898_00660 [Chitinophagaceae bacterium]|nr:hypothetical protein [Chitinophagaceae bacterium]MCW5915105.1 hypothetical protein [Chitinophagaceae bacterium]